MSQNLQNIAKFQKFQLENLVDFEKCCKTHIFLQKSEPIQPKTSNILPKFCQPTLSDVSCGRAQPRAPADPGPAGLRLRNRSPEKLYRTSVAYLKLDALTSARFAHYDWVLHLDTDHIVSPAMRMDPLKV